MFQNGSIVYICFAIYSFMIMTNDMVCKVH